MPLDADGEVVINHIRAIIGGTEQLELILMGVAIACIMVMSHSTTLRHVVCVCDALYQHPLFLNTFPCLSQLLLLYDYLLRR